VKRFRFEDGREAWGINRADALILHRQIFVDRSYERFELKLSAGACVFDVGANIGLFSTWLASKHPGLRLFLFEPIPEVFAALSRNAAELSATCELFSCGLSDHRGNAQFEYDPSLSSMSTMFPGTLTQSRQPAAVHTWAQASISMLEQAGAIPRPLGKALGSALESKVTRALTLAALAPVGAGLALRQKLRTRRITCQLRTVSDVLAEHSVESIALLKIDVEGAEEHVLRGIAERDWAKIEQLVIEVSDVDGRVKAIEASLRKRGFRVSSDQDDHALMKLLGLHNVYATR
jgi:FkbM family methyltransferase